MPIRLVAKGGLTRKIMEEATKQRRKLNGGRVIPNRHIKISLKTKDYEKLQEFSETAPEIKISQNSAEVPATVLSESRKLLIDTVGVATITTLPFFHIFGPKDVAKTCYFFVNEPPIFGSDSNYENALSSFISGRKKITSMYHEIDAKGRAFSEFTLVRN